MNYSYKEQRQLNEYVQSTMKYIPEKIHICYLLSGILDDWQAANKYQIWAVKQFETHTGGTKDVKEGNNETNKQNPTSQ